MGQSGDQIVPKSDEPRRIARAPQFIGEGARFSAMDAGEWMRSPGFAKDRDVYDFCFGICHEYGAFMTSSKYHA
jgi:hypothetical protein